MNISRMRLLRVAAVCSFPAVFLRSKKVMAKDNIEEGLPKQVDWVARGAVTPARDQGACGSCWAHAAVASIEGIHKIKYGELLYLSVQDVIDCAVRYEGLHHEAWKGFVPLYVQGKGCRGGTAKEAFEHAIHFGLASEIDYPQRRLLKFFGPIAGDGQCRAETQLLKPATFIDAHGTVEPNEAALMKAVARQPIVIRCDPVPDSLKQQYKGSIIEYEDWTPDEDLDPAKEVKAGHYILIVGYGEDENGNKFWKAKNSYGPRWGDKGFLYLRRGGTEMLGVAGIFRLPGFYPIKNSCD